MPINASPAYLERAKREAELIAPHWPASGYRILDIGCGLAAVDCFLWEYCPIEQIHLLDGDGPRKKEPYTDGSYAWNDVADAYRYVRQRCGACRVDSYYVDEPVFPKVDMVLSLRSWCHHYPAAVYLHRVMAALQPNGRLVVDCRAGTDNLAQLKAAGFSPIAILEESPKRRRYVLTR